MTHNELFHVTGVSVGEDGGVLIQFDHSRKVTIPHDRSDILLNLIQACGATPEGGETDLYLEDLVLCHCLAVIDGDEIREFRPVRVN